MTSTPAVKMEIATPEKLLPLMRLLLGRGIGFETYAGTSLRKFLEEILPADPDYIDNRIQTVFINGQAVDSPEDTYIREPCTIALSAAMPGVFGAAFRKKGLYSGLRRQYGKNQGTQKESVSGKLIPVTIKCFNQVANDLGNALLGRGVRISAADFAKFWNQQHTVLEKECRQISINGEQINPAQLPDILDGKTGDLELRINCVK